MRAGGGVLGGVALEVWAWCDAETPLTEIRGKEQGR